MYTLKNANIDREHIFNSIIDCIYNKMDRDEVYNEISLYTNGLFSADDIRKQYMAGGMKNIEDHLIVMTEVYYYEIKCRCIEFGPINYKYKTESNNKTRKIAIQTIKQLIFDYIFVNGSLPLFNRAYGVNQCASIPGKGQIYAKELLEDWIQNDKKNTKYYIKTDIKQYFPSINHTLLMNMVRKHVADSDLLYILETILDTYPPIGLNIGSYLSQYMANYFISDIYHELTENMIAYRRDIKYNMVSHMIIYMDDIILFCRYKKDRDAIYYKLKELLEYKYLSIHHTMCAKIKKDSFIDAFGFRFYRDHTTIRKRIHKRILKLKPLSYKNRMTLGTAYKIVSYNGILIHSDSVKFMRQHNLKPYIEQAKQKISEHDSRLAKM